MKKVGRKKLRVSALSQNANAVRQREYYSRLKQRLGRLQKLERILDLLVEMRKLSVEFNKLMEELYEEKKDDPKRVKKAVSKNRKKGT